MKYLYYSISLFFSLILVCSCKKDDVDSDKLLGKWVLSSGYTEFVDGEVEKYQYDIKDERASFNFISKDKVIISAVSYIEDVYYETLTITLNYTYNESEKKLIVWDELVKNESIIELVDSKTMVVRVYNNKGPTPGDNLTIKFSESTYVKL